MSHLIVKTLYDLHCGRMTWRVIVLLSIPSTCAAVIAAML